MPFDEQWYSDDQALLLAALAASTARFLLGAVVEIGAWQGKSTVALANAVYPLTVHVVDTWRGNEAEVTASGQPHPSVQAAQERDVYAEFWANIRAQTQKNILAHCSDWRAVFDTGVWRDPICFAHIDASHDYRSVADCIRALLPWLVPGGLLCGDDFRTASRDRADLQGGVQRAVEEVLPGHIVLGNLWIWQQPGLTSVRAEGPRQLYEAPITVVTTQGPLSPAARAFDDYIDRVRRMGLRAEGD